MSVKRECGHAVKHISCQHLASRHQFILMRPVQRVPEVWKRVDVEGGGGITEGITNDGADKEDINDCKGDETVVECGSSVLPENDHNGSYITSQPHDPHHRQGHPVHV